MRDLFQLKSTAFDDVVLRTATEENSESLRQWKNANRALFFFQGLITPEGQNEWFKAYLDRANDYMFLVCSEDLAIGSMGFRLLQGHADIYNVILGLRAMGGKGRMAKAMRLMCSFIHSDFTPHMGVKVLRSNPAAIAWYLENGFTEVARHDEFLELQVSLSEFQPCGFKKLAYPKEVLAKKKRGA